MILDPLDVLTLYPIRKQKQQKQTFREDVMAFAKTIGYEGKVEKGGFDCRNVVFGDPENAEYLVTAHYDTCATLPFPNLITPCNFWTYLAYQLGLTCIMFLLPVAAGCLTNMITKELQSAYWIGYLALWGVLALMIAGPANRHNANDNTSGVVTVLKIMQSLPESARNRVAFVLFDLEEAGLIGSASYRKAHKKQIQSQIILNLDCVGDGDEILLFPTKELKSNAAKLDKLRCISTDTGKKSITLHENGFYVYPSDQKNFPYGVGIAAFHRSKGGILYCNRIHTAKDTILEEENITLLTEKLVQFLNIEKE